MTRNSRLTLLWGLNVILIACMTFFFKPGVIFPWFAVALEFIVSTVLYVSSLEEEDK